MSNFSTLLVANRGEIALRVMRTAKAVGLNVVAVYSDADVDAPHVRFADDAVRLGPAPAGESYLDADKVLDAARATGAGAIHPGYGFLSENAAFASAVADAGLVFVGPPAQAIELMGDKAVAKRRMLEAGVPCVPGYEGEQQADEHFISAASDIGFPVMVKAAAGGGGRGMRLVTDADTLPDALRLARSEAENAFGSGDLILEKAIVRPRHVELQVFADDHGNVIHLGERDCSVQRRHQKVLEEAPCPVMNPELRAQMGAAAVDAARAVAYRGAGTVEFLLDPRGDFYFLEMNTRLQVEHPVTEMITGLDLVALQLQVARGLPLGLHQEDIRLHGHAIEARLYAEDPAQDFLPSTGPVHRWGPPEGEGVRVDAGIVTGGEVSPYYDSMVAKIVAGGADRHEARLKLRRALQQTTLFGPSTNRDFLIDALGRDGFADGSATTAFIEETYGDAGFDPGPVGAAELAAAAVIQHRVARSVAWGEAVGVSAELLDWSSAADLETVVAYPAGEAVATIRVIPSGSDAYSVRVDDETSVDVSQVEISGETARMCVDGRMESVRFYPHGENTLYLHTALRSFSVTDTSGAAVGDEESGGGGTVAAPMHGLLLELLVTEGDPVTKGDKLAVLEAMKMQHEILAEVDGTVSRVAASEGAQLSAEDLILQIEPLEAESE